MYVYDWYNRFPVSVVSLKESGIETPRTSEARRWASPTAGASYVGWRALAEGCRAERDRCHPGSHRLHPGGGLTSGQVDAAVCYYMNEPVQMQQGGTEVNLMLVADYAASLPTNGIITNEATIAERPDLVERLLRAFHRGLQFTLDNPDEAFAIAERAVPEISGNREVQRAVLDASLELWQAEGLGLSDEESWAQASEIMLRAGLILPRWIPLRRSPTSSCRRNRPCPNRLSGSGM